MVVRTGCNALFPGQLVIVEKLATIEEVTFTAISCSKIEKRVG